MEQKTLAISLALGDLYDEAGYGDLRYPIDGAVARFEAVTRGMSCDTSSLVVCTAGFCKNDPRVPQLHRRISLATQLNNYLIANRNFDWVERLFAKPMCWSTRNEVRLGIKVAQHTGFANKNERVTVRIASNMSHLIRIWLYAEMYTPDNWKFQLVRARHRFSLISHLLEIPKFMRDLWYVIKVRNRLKRITRRLKK
jgi:hypothetical protein